MKTLKLFLFVFGVALLGCRRGDNSSAPYVPIAGATIAPKVGMTIRYSPVGPCSNPIWIADKASVIRITALVGNDADVTALASGESILQVECDSGLIGRIMIYVQ